MNKWMKRVSNRYRWCSSLAQSPKHPDGNAIARIARPVQHSGALLARLLAATAAAAIAAQHAGASAYPSLLHDGDTSRPSWLRPISPPSALPAHSIAGGSSSSDARLASFPQTDLHRWSRRIGLVLSRGPDSQGTVVSVAIG